MKAKDLNKSILLSILNLFCFGRSSIKPTKHYLRNHADVDWELVELAILSPTKIKADKRYGKNRYAYIRVSKNFIIKVHVEIGDDERIWVINAFINKK